MHTGAQKVGSASPQGKAEKREQDAVSAPGNWDIALIPTTTDCQNRMPESLGST